MNAATHTDDAQFQYVDGQARPAFPALLAEFQARSDALIQAVPCSLDMAYGPHERERFDFFPAQAPDGGLRGTLLYYHAGYWHLRDKSLFRFIAPAFTRRGLNVALVNYPLCPEVTVAELLESARASIPALLEHTAGLGQPKRPLIATGHSAGGQIAVEMALSRCSALGGDAQAVDAVIGVSGVYDLLPLVGTTLNQSLRLDVASAVAVSPLRRELPRAHGRPMPALFIVGAAETPAFVDQSRRMCEAWEAAGHPAQLFIASGCDHFSVLAPFTSHDGALALAIDALLGRL